MDKRTEFARSLRRDMTKEERHLWYDYLRAYPLRFMRQRPIGPYIVDFYCAKACLVIELDGGQHFEDAGREADAARDRALAARGIAVLRIPNNEIHTNFSGVCEAIDREVRRRALQRLSLEKGAVSEAD